MGREWNRIVWTVWINEEWILEDISLISTSQGWRVQAPFIGIPAKKKGELGPK